MQNRQGNPFAQALLDYMQQNNIGNDSNNMMYQSMNNIMGSGLMNPQRNKNSWLEKLGEGLGKLLGPNQQIPDMPQQEATQADRTVNQEGINLIKGVEGFRSNAYRKKGDVWTLGYGQTHGIREGMTITEPEAETQLRKHVRESVEPLIKKAIKGKLTENQYAALASAVYVAGHVPPALASHINSGNYSTFERDMRNHYDSIIRRHPVKAKFRRGWFNRTKKEAKLFYTK